MKFFSLALMAFSFAAVGENTHAATPVKVELAYRNAAGTNEGERRLVVLQGARDSSDPTRFTAACGATGTGCECLLFRTADDKNPLIGSGIGVSEQNNTFSCRVPGNSADAAHFVRLRLRSDKTPVTAITEIRTSLTLHDVLGKLDSNHVRSIYRYSCESTFFEGEGVTDRSISCVPGQHLGLITASYSFYTYASTVDSNSPGGDKAFASPICGRNDLLELRCTGNAPTLEFGYYREEAAPFVVSISMTRAPYAAPGDKQPLTESYGYAALPDSAGNCPIGLVKARPYEAQPSSILPRGPSCPADGCPSNFVNYGSNLNNNVIAVGTPPEFTVTRQPNSVPCSAQNGDCTNARFSGKQVAQAVGYAPLMPILCVIPKELLF